MASNKIRTKVEKIKVPSMGRKAKRPVKHESIGPVRGYKAIQEAVKIYRDLRAAGKIDKLEAFEKINKFVGKRGGILKRAVRYKKGQEELKKLSKQIKQQYGREPSQKRIREAGEEQRRLNTEALKKAGATYAKHHGAKDNRFKRVAREQTAKYGKMVDVFASDTYEKLKSQAYGIGSDVVEKLIEDGWDPEEAVEFLNQVMETMNDIPAEARNLADQDTFWQNIKDMSEIIQSGGIDADNMKDVLVAYMTTDDREAFQEALENYVEMGEDIPFGQIWEELQYYDDKGSADNMQEVIDEIRGE